MIRSVRISTSQCSRCSSAVRYAIEHALHVNNSCSVAVEVGAVVAVLAALMSNLKQWQTVLKPAYKQGGAERESSQVTSGLGALPSGPAFATHQVDFSSGICNIYFPPF